MLNLISLFDFDANAHTVDTGLDQNSFILISCHSKRIQKNLRRGLRFDFWDIVPFRRLRGEVR